MARRRRGKPPTGWRFLKWNPEAQHQGWPWQTVWRPFVDEVRAASMEILDQGVRLPDEEQVSHAKDQRDLRYVVAVAVSKGLKRGIWQCYLGCIMAENIYPALQKKMKLECADTGTSAPAS